jgi:Phage tail tube protein, GTA-gp10
MLINRKRGEISADLGGKERALCLTLGALAELEAAFGASDLMALTGRFSSGKLAAGDLLTIIHAGLNGAGHTFTREEVAEMQTDGGAAGYARIVSELLQVTFGGDG